MPKADHPYAHGSHIAMENEKQNTLFQKDNFIPYTGSIAVQKQDKAGFELKCAISTFRNKWVKDSLLKAYAIEESLLSSS